MIHQRRLLYKALIVGTFMLLGSGRPLYAQSGAIAVLDFDGVGIAESEAVALSNRLRNEIFKTGTQVVERGMMQSIMAEQDFQLSGCTTDECLVEVGQLLGATRMVGGSISKVGNTYTVSARLVDVGSGELLAVADVDLRGEVDDMLTRGMGLVARKLMAGAAPEVEASMASMPAQPVELQPAKGTWVFSAGAPVGETGYSIELVRVMGTRWVIGNMGLQPYINIDYTVRAYEDPDIYSDDMRGSVGVGIVAGGTGRIPVRAYFDVGYGAGEYFIEEEGLLDYFSDAGELVLNLGGQIVFAELGRIGILADARLHMTANYGASFVMNLGIQF